MESHMGSPSRGALAVFGSGFLLETLRHCPGPSRKTLLLCTRAGLGEGAATFHTLSKSTALPESPCGHHPARSTRPFLIAVSKPELLGSTCNNNPRSCRVAWVLPRGRGTEKGGLQKTGTEQMSTEEQREETVLAASHLVPGSRSFRRFCCISDLGLQGIPTHLHNPI